MAHITADRVRDTTTTTGTGALTVSGTAPSYGYRTFSAVCSTSDTFWYCVAHQSAEEWEVGLGTYSSSNTITRTTVIASSNSNSAVSFSAGTKDVFITLAAGKTLQYDASGNVNIGTTGVAAKLYVSGNAAANIAALTDGATIAVDMSTANNFSVTLGGNRTLGNPTNLIAGQSGVIFITQDGTGGRTLGYSSYWDFPNATAPTLTTTASAVDVLVYSVRSTTSIAAQLLTNIG